MSKTQQTLADILPELVQLYAPTGARITATADRMLCTAHVHGFTRAAGALVPSYTGDTEAHWDTQETITRCGWPVYVDERGAEWTAAQVSPVRPAPGAPIPPPVPDTGTVTIDAEALLSLLTVTRRLATASDQDGSALLNDADKAIRRFIP